MTSHIDLSILQGDADVACVTQLSFRPELLLAVHLRHDPLDFTFDCWRTLDLEVVEVHRLRCDGFGFSAAAWSWEDVIK